jgi:uncharacterized protein (TIRG00374 family)
VKSLSDWVDDNRNKGELLSSDIKTPAGAKEEKQRLLTRPLVKILIAILIGVGLLIGIFDIRKILTAVQKIEPLFLFLAFFSTVFSYLFIGLSLRRLLTLIGERLSFQDIFAISWVSTSLNYLISTGGVGGLTMRVFLLRKKNITFSETFLVSFVHTLLLNGVLIGFVTFGFGYLLTSRGLRFYQYLTSGTVLAVALILSFLATGSVVNKAFRERFIDFFYRLINRISFRLRKKLVFKKSLLNEFKEDFHRGISLMLTRKRGMIVPTLYVFLDWFCCLLTLYFSFVTIGYRISPGVLVVGFALGIFVSLISVVPGALGIMEGSMAAIYYSLAVPLEIAILAVLLYRFVYYVFPFLTSAVFYYPLFKEAKAIRISAVAREPLNPQTPSTKSRGPAANQGNATRLSSDL